MGKKMKCGIIKAASLLLLFNLGCSEGFQTNVDNKLSSTGGSLQDGNLAPLTPPEVNGKVEGGLWDGKEILDVDWLNKELIIKMPMDFQAEIVEGRIVLPKQPDIKIEIATNTDGNQQVQVRVPIAKLFGATDPFLRSRLPNGDPLPRVPGGELPRIDANLSNQDVHFYMGEGTVAAFIPTKFDPHVYMVFPIKNKDGSTLGYFATIPEKGELHRGGFYASLQLPDDLKNLIEGYLDLSGN